MLQQFLADRNPPIFLTALVALSVAHCIYQQQHLQMRELEISTSNPKLFLNSYPEWGHKDGPTLLWVRYALKWVQIHLNKRCKQSKHITVEGSLFQQELITFFSTYAPYHSYIGSDPLQYVTLLCSRNSRCDVPPVCASEIAGITTWVSCPAKKYLMKPPKGGHTSKHLLCRIQLNKKIGNNNHRCSMTS